MAMMKEKNPKKWMQNLDIKKGALTKQAKAAGRSVAEQAQWQKAHGTTKQKRQANLYFTFMKANKKRKAKKSLAR